MSGKDALVVFTPSGRRGRFPVGTPVLQAARSLGVDIDSVCGGRGICGRCQVLVSEGEFAKHGLVSRAENLSPVSPVEQTYCSIDVPSSSQVHKQVVRKEAEAHDVELDPLIRLHFVEVQQPDMHDPSGDLRRLEDALEFEWRLTDLACDVIVLQQLQTALRQGDWKVTVAVHAGQQIVAVWPGFREHAYGLAIDVGSTTIAAHLCHLASGEVVASAGVMNPQIRFGEDLMSRVSYVMMNPGGEKEMTAAVRAALNELAAEAARHSGSHLRRQSHHASPAVGHQPGRAGRCALCAGDGSGHHPVGGRNRLCHSPQCPYLRAALHRWARGRRHRWCDIGRTP